jgi:co-chaperonin GroES (HSP10)
MEQTETFTETFRRLRELGDSTFVLRGSTMIVEIIRDEELKTKGGIIIATDSRHTRGGSVEQHKLQVGRVLMTGKGYYDAETGTYEPLEVQPGSIVVLPQYSLQTISTFPGIQRPTENKLCMVKEADLLAYYTSEEAYTLAKAKLNA